MDYEKKPKFKVGDTIRHKAHGDKYHYTIHCILNDAYVLDNDLVLTFNMEDSWELVESEDEKIRKAIGYAIGQSTHSDGTLINGISSEEALAWLEKQGEQKPEWSEEDEKMLNAVIKSCENCGNEYAYYWLKSLKERVQLKQEWSEEDEKYFNILLSIAVSPSSQGVYNYHQIDKSIFLDWVKTLHPQNAWKPGEEQLNALSIAVKHGQTDDPDALKELLEQLKKLKEG